jgi:O-antigen/teichoic acid export membrane protein
MVLKIIQNVIQAYQLNAFASFLDALSNILALGFIYLLTVTMAPDLSKIALVFSIAPIIVLFLASVLLYSTRFRKISPRIGYIRMSFAKDIFNLGSEFFIIQIAALVLYQMINILISKMCGPEEVTNYNIAYKYLNILLMGTTIVMAPMWSAFTDAFTKNDLTWMKNIYDKLIKMFYLAVGVIVLMVVVSPWVYRIWIGENSDVTFVTSLLVGLYVIIGVWGQIHSTILNGMGKIRFQVIYSLIIMIAFIPLTLLLGHLFGLPGILSAMILVNVPGSFFGRYQVVGLMNNTVKGIWTK